MTLQNRLDGGPQHRIQGQNSRFSIIHKNIRISAHLCRIKKLYMLSTISNLCWSFSTGLSPIFSLISLFSKSRNQGFKREKDERAKKREGMESLGLPIGVLLQESCACTFIRSRIHAPFSFSIQNLYIAPKSFKLTKTWAYLFQEGYI